MASIAALKGLQPVLLTRLPHYSIVLSKRNIDRYCIDPSIGLTEDQRRLQERARKFATNVLMPRRKEWNKLEKVPPKDILRRAGERGFGAIYCKQLYGGSGMPRIDSAIIYEQLAVGCASSAAYMSIHNLCAWMIDKFGSEELRKTYIPRMATFDLFAAYFLAEPISGDDPEAIQTTAKREGDWYIINGSKLAVLGYPEAPLYVITIRHDKQTASRGIFSIALDSSTEGIVVSTPSKGKKYSWKDDLTPRTITFHNCRVPVSNQIGGDVDGLTMANIGINGSRVNIAACWLGAAQRSIDMTIQHFREDPQRVKSVEEFKEEELRFAELATKLCAARLLVREAASQLQERSVHLSSYCAMAKLHAEMVCSKIMNEVLSLYKRYGLTDTSQIEDYLHDCKSHDFVIGSGTEMRVLVAENILSKKTFFDQK